MMDWEKYGPEVWAKLTDEMRPRVKSAIDALEKELCVDPAGDDEDQRAVLLIMISSMLLERSVMALAALGLQPPWIAERVERSYNRMVDSLKQRSELS